MVIRNPFRPIYDKINAITASGGPVPEFPLLVDVEIVNACNLKCSMCEHKYITRKKEMMSEDIYKEILEQCRPYKPGIRFLMYSEPFLHPNIFEMIKYTRDQGFYLHITSNGTVVTKEHIDRLIDIGLDSIVFSLQGATEEEYTIIRKSNKLSAIEENVRYLVKKRKTKPYLQISTTVSSRDSVEEISRFKEKWEQYADLVTVGKTMWSRIAEKDPKVLKNLGLMIDTRREYVPCHDVMSKIAIFPNGDITVCCGDPDGKMVMGNILRNDIRELWHSDAYNSIRILLKEKKMYMFDLCKTCYPAYDFAKEPNKEVQSKYINS
jgi:radical SAM protein with 4Fe4S-binding SPASM domain